MIIDGMDQHKRATYLTAWWMSRLELDLLTIDCQFLCFVAALYLGGWVNTIGVCTPYIQFRVL